MYTHLQSPSEQVSFLPAFLEKLASLHWTRLCSKSNSERLFGLLPVARILIRDATQSGKTLKQWVWLESAQVHDSDIGSNCSELVEIDLYIPIIGAINNCLNVPLCTMEHATQRNHTQGFCSAQL